MPRVCTANAFLKIVKTSVLMQYTHTAQTKGQRKKERKREGEREGGWVSMLTRSMQYDIFSPSWQRSKILHFLCTEMTIKCTEMSIWS